MEKKEKNYCYVTDYGSINTISPGVRKSTISVERITGSENIKNFFDEIKKNYSIVNKMKRDGYAYGLSRVSGIDFPVAKDPLVDAPYGSIVVWVGISNPTKMDSNNKENWDKGYFNLELTVGKINKTEE